MRHLIIFILAVIMAVVAAPAYSHDGSTYWEAVSIEIASERGDTFLVIPHKEYQTGGTHVIKQYLEARQGVYYGICIRNTTPDRIGVVIAVDGRNIISGKQSDLKNNEPMYIVNSYGYGRYDGWRTNSISPKWPTPMPCGLSAMPRPWGSSPSPSIGKKSGLNPCTSKRDCMTHRRGLYRRSRSGAKRKRSGTKAPARASGMSTTHPPSGLPSSPKGGRSRKRSSSTNGVRSCAEREFCTAKRNRSTVSGMKTNMPPTRRDMRGVRNKKSAAGPGRILLLISTTAKTFFSQSPLSPCSLSKKGT